MGLCYNCFNQAIPSKTRSLVDKVQRFFANDHATRPSRGVRIMSQILSVPNATMEGAMLRILSVLCLVMMTTSAVRMSAQVYPYRDGTPDVTGYRSEVMAEVMIQESEFVRLADAIPADKYTWRPSPDVRSMADAGLEKALDWNGGKITERGVLLYIVQHIAQHLGQQIAYSR